MLLLFATSQKGRYCKGKNKAMILELGDKLTIFD